MALTVTESESNIFGTTKVWIGTVTFDNSYATGGEDLAPADLGLVEVLHLATQSAGGYVFSYNHATAKLLAYRGTGDTAGPLPEVPNATNLSAVTTRVFAIGR